MNYVSEEFKLLIDGLLTKDVRFHVGHIGGAKEIMAHSYFVVELCPPQARHLADPAYLATTLCQGWV